MTTVSEQSLRQCIRLGVIIASPIRPNRVAGIPCVKVSREGCYVSPKGGQLMKCIALSKAANPVTANQLPRPSCLMVYVKFQFMHTIRSWIDCQLLLASTSSNVLLRRGSQTMFNEFLGMTNVFPSAVKVQLLSLIIMSWQVYHLARLVGKVAMFHHRRTNWWGASLYQKQRNRSRLNSWVDCLA